MFCLPYRGPEIAANTVEESPSWRPAHFKPEADLFLAAVDRLEMEQVANEIVAAIKGDKIFPRLRGIMPARWFDTVGGEWLGVYHSMSGFTGRA